MLILVIFNFDTCRIILYKGRHYNTQGPPLLRDWSVGGDRGGGATATGECRLRQIKIISAFVDVLAEIIVAKIISE